MPAVFPKTSGKDISAEKATYPALYGLEETRKLAENVLRQACQELEKIDKETSLLREIADFILNREEMIFVESYQSKSV